MTATLVNTETEVLQHVQSLCEVLRQDYIKYYILQHNRSIDYADAGDVASVRYHELCIQDLRNGICDYDFTFESGRKYHKVIMVIDNGPEREVSRSVHCFIDKKTGSVLKSSSWRSPAKGERYNLLLIKDREWLFENADWSSGYLYKR